MKSFTLSPVELSLCQGILKQHSVTYYNATKLFPRHIQPAVFALYAWVRLADEVVDNPKSPPDAALSEFENQFDQAITGKNLHTHQVHYIFARLTQHCKFERNWISAFINAMKLDLIPHHFYHTRTDLQQYTFGSAEVIGLMMARIMGVSRAGETAAKNLGEWMQLVNFIRDFAEDLRLRQRLYVPLEVLNTFHLQPELLLQYSYRHQVEKLISSEANRLTNQLPAIYQSLHHIPPNCRRAVQVSVDLYRWTLTQIQRQPLIVFDRQVKPTKTVVLTTLAKAYLPKI